MNVVGAVRITIQSAHVLQWSAFRGGPPNPFVSISLNEGNEVEKTSHRLRDFNPTWMETKFIVLRSLDDTLALSLFDHHAHRNHRLLGVSRYQLCKLREATVQCGLALPLLKRDKLRGELLIDLIYYPARRTDHSDDFSAGIVSLSDVQARNLDARRARSGHVSPIAKVSLGCDDVPIFVTEPRSRTNNPVWQSKHDFYCPRKESLIITIKVVDDNLDDPVVGQASLQLNDLLDGSEAGIQWWPMSGCKSGDVRMTAIWTPLDLDSH
jgi:Ca2+-dependent lipid-binding protein